MNVNSAQFVISVGASGGYPPQGPCEIAMVGRSNVGKSSLINAVCNRNKLAKTSQHPGKTRLINYFLINDAFYLVDLPGYGYATASKGEITQWGALMEGYLSSGRLAHIFLLLDIRHDPTAQDRQMFEYIQYYAIPHTVIATKADKLARSKRAAAADKVVRSLGSVAKPICFSAVEKLGVEQVREAMHGIVQDHANIASAAQEATVE